MKQLIAILLTVGLIGCATTTPAPVAPSQPSIMDICVKVADMKYKTAEAHKAADANQIKDPQEREQLQKLLVQMDAVVNTTIDNLHKKGIVCPQ